MAFSMLRFLDSVQYKVLRCKSLIFLPQLVWSSLSSCNDVSGYVQKQKLRFPSHQMSWVSEWVSQWFIDWVRDFSPRASSAMEGIWHKGSLRGEDDARTSNMRIVHAYQRESARYHTLWKIWHALQGASSNRQTYDWWHIACRYRDGAL